jgi:hypothetical protein
MESMKLPTNPPEIELIEDYGRLLRRIDTDVRNAPSFDAAMQTITVGSLATKLRIEEIQTHLKMRDSLLKTLLASG